MERLFRRLKGFRRIFSRFEKLDVVFLAAITLTVYAGYRWWDYARTWVTTDNAYVTAHLHPIASRVTGTVLEVLVSDNQLVQNGQVLVRLDPGDFAVRVEQARAQLAQAQAQARQATAHVAQAEAQLTQEQARAVKAQQDLRRAETLYHGSAGAISRDKASEAKFLKLEGAAMLNESEK